MTSHGSVMTSLTDHSVESILRHNSNATSASDVTGHVTGKRSPTPTKEVVSSSRAGTKPRVVLECKDLWHQFYGLSTEMIITKSGRFVLYGDHHNNVNAAFLSQCYVHISRHFLIWKNIVVMIFFQIRKCLLM